ncbi:MAG: WYL domain-containing protein [Candidatus Methylomirabilia bacterium]
MRQPQEESTRLVDSYHLTFHRGGLYLIGYCHARARASTLARS